MICPVCDAEVWDLEAASCRECGTLLASWEACDRKFHARSLVRCCRCGECPCPGDRVCRQCQVRFLKRVPAWLNAEFPGWFDSDEQAPVSTFHCISCEMEVLEGSAKCRICGFHFYKPAEISAINPLEMVLARHNDAPPAFTSANPSSAHVPAAAPALSTDASKRVSDTKRKQTPPLLTPVPAKLITIPPPVPVQPTVKPVNNPTRKARKGERLAAVAAVIVARIISPRAKLLAERQASYKALLASGSIRPVPSLKWLSRQPVVCAQGHRTQFGLFADRSDYGTLDSIPDFKPVTWQDRLAAAFQARDGAARDDINDRDPELDVCWSLGCPMCGTDQYTFEAAALRDYVMCTASADYWWVFCHLYRKDSKTCGNCELRRNYWTALRALE